MNVQVISERKDVLVGRAELVVNARAGAPCCCGDVVCDDGIHTSEITSTSGWSHMSGDTITVINNRPTFSPGGETQYLSCFVLSDAYYACGSNQFTGGDPLRVEYDFLANFETWITPQRALNGDGTFPACNDAECGFWSGTTSGCGPNIFDEPECAGGCTVGQPTAYRAGYWNPGYPCATAGENACCVDGAVPPDCFKGGLTLYQQRVATDDYQWAADVFLFGDAAQIIDADATDSSGAVLYAGPTSLARQFLGILHREAHYQFSPLCVDLPSDLDPETNLSAIVPERFIAIRSGVPIFEFQLREAAARSIITETEADDAIAALRLQGECGTINQGTLDATRAVMDALREAGWLATKDHRGDIAAEINALAAIYAPMASARPGGVDVLPGDLAILGPYRLIPSWPYVDPDDVYTTAGADAFQLPAYVLGVAEPDEVTEAAEHALWTALRSVFFRCWPGSWDFAAWTWVEPLRPENNWEGGRRIGTNIEPWTQSGVEPSTDFSWVTNGSPRTFECVERVCDPPNDEYDWILTNFCDGECAISALPLCDLQRGYVSYFGDQYVFASAWGKYNTDFTASVPCHCQGFTTSTAQRVRINCDWSTASVPWKNVIRADPVDQAWMPRTLDIGLSSQYPCVMCVFMQVEFPTITPDDLCPHHACFVHTDSPPSCQTLFGSNPDDVIASSTGEICTP